MTKNPIKIIILLIILAIVVAAFFAVQHKKTPPTPQKNSSAVSIDTADQPAIGNPDASLHFIAFEDLKCMNCKRFNNEIFPQLKKAYLDTGKASYTLINLAFIPGSMQAATTARCLYAQKTDYFFQFVDTLYHNQGEETEDWTTIPLMLKYANAIKGVDSEKLSECVLNNSGVDFIINNLSIAKKAMGDTVYTPALYLNGHKIDNLDMQSINTAVNDIKSDK